MKHLKKFNENNGSEINEKSLQEIFSEGVNVTIKLSDLLSDSNFLILADDGKIFEFKKGDLQDVWESNDEFKEQTGASLYDEYAGNKSEELLRFLEEKVDDYRIGHIQSIHFEGVPGIISKLIK